MKTFIWNREYEVVAANAETVEQARELLKPKLDEFFAYRVEEIMNDRIKHKGEQFGNYNCTWEEETQYRLDSIEREKKIIDEEPHIIIKENEGIIFDHGNE